jgi:hypothetical protein
MPKRIRFSIAVAAFAAAVGLLVGLPLLPRANAQISKQEFQMYEKYVHQTIMTLN